MDRPTCGTCVFFDDKLMECHAQAPANSTGSFPPMQPDKWCGEHQDMSRYVEHVRNNPSKFCDPDRSLVARAVAWAKENRFGTISPPTRFKVSTAIYDALLQHQELPPRIHTEVPTVRLLDLPVTHVPSMLDDCIRIEFEDGSASAARLGYT